MKKQTDCESSNTSDFLPLVEKDDLNKVKVPSLSSSKSISEIGFYKYAHYKKKPVMVVFSYPQLLSKQCLEIIKNKIEKGFTYSVIERVKYGKNEYYMAGTNFGFKYNDLDNSQNLEIFYKKMHDKIYNFFNNELSSGQKLTQQYLDRFEVLFRQTDKKFLSDLKLDSSSTVITADMKQRDIFNK